MISENKTKKLAEIRAQECLAVRVRLISRVITNIYDRALRPYGIKLNQVSMLTVISLSDGQKPGDVSKILHMEKSTVSRNIERMRKKGWLKIMKETGGVSQTLMVTEEGNKLLRDIHDGWIDAQKKAADFIGNEGIRIIKMLTDTIWPSKKRGK